MHNHGKESIEKSKNFTEAIKRLFKELNIFKTSIIIALLLAMAGSIFSIIAPDKLSNLTDEIQKGLVVKKDNLETITTTITSNFSNIDINKITTSNLLTEKEKQDFLNIISGDKENILPALSSLSPNVLNIILPPFKVDNVIISSLDQVEFLKVFSNIGEGNQKDVSLIYKSIDKMPKSIKQVVEPFMDITSIKTIILFLVGLYVISSLFVFIQSLLMANVSNNFAKVLRNRIITKINKMPLSYFDRNQTGDILSRVTNDVDTISHNMNNSLSTLVSATTLFIGTIIMMFVTNWIMAMTAIVSSLIGFVFMFMILSKSQKYFIQRQVELGKLNAHIEEIYSSILVVKAYNGKKQADIKFDECNNKVYDANRKSQFLSGLMPPMMHFIGNFGYVAVCVVGALLTMNEVITFGVIVAFITYVRLFTSPLNQIAQAMNSMQSTAAASERVFEFLDEEELTDEKEITTVLNKEDVKGNIEFCNVKFGYDKDKIIIKDFNAKVTPGQKIAIVGPTGAGKTTMVNLLMKFYELNSGDIKIDGVSIKDLTRENVHMLFTMVLQDAWLFGGSIRENIIYNREGITDEEIMKVCDVVGISHFIKTLPHGLDSDISENDSVSSGQKQLITIARAMIEDAPFLILDEATSNVDTRTEELVQKAMDKLTEGKTSFIIAHRLSTIKNADLILVMKGGNIIEIGNHEELLDKKGFYADLYNSQFEL